MATNVTPPPGFELDQPTDSSSISNPTPPPGFELDQPNKPQMGNPDMSLGQKYQTAKYILGQIHTPTEMIQSGLNKAGDWIASKGGEAGVNPYLAAGVGTAVSRFPAILGAYTALPQNAQAGVNEFGSNILGKLGDETGGGGGPLPPSTPQPPAPVLSEPNYLQQTGGAGLNAQAGIRGGTIAKLARSGQNPGKVGINLAQELNDAGVIGKDPIETWDRVSGMIKNVGQQIGNDKQAIAAEAAKYGAVNNPLEMDATEALKPMADRIKDIGQNITGVGQDVAQKMQGVYDKLMEFADSQGGKLNLDHVDKALSEIGPLTNKGSPENMALYRDIFHTVADTRDAMVQSVANGANNPALAQNLLDHNALYSKLMRVMPDISKASGNAAVGQKRLIDMFNDLQQLIVNRGGMSLGSTVPNPSQATAGFKLASQAAPIIKGKLNE